MSGKFFYRITLLVIAISITGCTSALALRDANEQLTTYYSAKVEALQVEPKDSFVLVENAKASLKTLAESAAEQAQKEEKPLNKISFYRIATTAAWQAGDANVVAYANAGTALCDEGLSSKAPRDCGMLAVMPILASVDEQTLKFNALQDKLDAASPPHSEADIKAAESLLKNYSAAYKKLVEKRSALRNTGAHPDFLKGLDNNIGTLLCSHINTDTRGLLVRVGSPLRTAMNPDVKEMKCSLIKAKVDLTFTTCVTPQDCE